MKRNKLESTARDEQYAAKAKKAKKSKKPVNLELASEDNVELIETFESDDSDLDLTYYRGIYNSMMDY